MHETFKARKVRVNLSVWISPNDNIKITTIFQDGSFQGYKCLSRSNFIQAFMPVTTLAVLMKHLQGPWRIKLKSA